MTNLNPFDIIKTVKGKQTHKERWYKMFYITVGFIRYGFKVATMEEAEKEFEKACKEFRYDYIAIRNEKGLALKERF